MKLLIPLVIVLTWWQCPANIQAYDYAARHICSKIKSNDTILEDIHAFYFFEDKLHILDGDSFYIAEFRAKKGGEGYEVRMPKEYSTKVVSWGQRSFINPIARLHPADIYKAYFPFKVDADHLWMIKDTLTERAKFYTFDIQTFRREPAPLPQGTEIKWIMENRIQDKANETATYVLNQNNTDGFFLLKATDGKFIYKSVPWLLENIRDHMGKGTFSVIYDDLGSQQLLQDYWNEKPPFGVYHDGKMFLMHSNHRSVGIYDVETQIYNTTSYQDFFNCTQDKSLVNLFLSSLSKQKSWTSLVVAVPVITLIGVIWVCFSRRRKRNLGTFKRGDKSSNGLRVASVRSSFASSTLPASPSSTTGATTSTSSRKDATPQKSSQKDVVPPKSSQKDVVPPKALQKDVAPTKAFQKDVAPPKAFQKDVAPPKSSQKDVAPPKSSQKDVAPPKAFQKDVARPSTPTKGV